MATGGREDGRGTNGNQKPGTVVPNRIFVGGLNDSITEEDLKHLFSQFANVKATKILLDKAGISRGYGFVTFETEEEAQSILKMSKRLTLKDRPLNIATAVKKQPYSRTLESNSVHNTIVWPTQPYSGSSTAFTKESVYYPQATWPFMWPQQFYLQQQCQYPQIPQTGYPQYVYIAPNDYQYSSAGQVSGSDYSETSSADSGENLKNRSKPNCSVPLPSEYDRSHCVNPAKSGSVPSAPSHRYSGGSVESTSGYFHSAAHLPHMHHPLFAKTVNGVAVMAYPSSIVMGSPALIHVKDGGDNEGVFTELGFLQSPVTAGALTPPSTPLASLSCDLNSSDSHRKN